MIERAFPRIGPFALALLAGVALTGCAGGADWYFGGSQVADPAKIVAEADWDKAQRIKVDIRQDEFRPAIVRMFVGEPYILAFENRDPVSHSVAASEFFSTVALRHIVSGETVSAENSSVRSFSVAPGETMEVHVVPTLDGWYQFSDSSSGLLFWSKAAVLGTVGSFIVGK